MADNTVTIPDTRGCPGKKNLKILDAIPHAISGIAYTRTSAIPFQIGGVEIREPEQNIRQRIQPEPGVAMEKGKKKMRMETPSDTDSDSDDELLSDDSYTHKCTHKCRHKHGWVSDGFCC